MDRNERQNLGINKWVKSGCRGTLQWATGVGKTRAGIKSIKLFLTKNKGKKVVVVVPTEYLKIQWMTELNKNKLINDVTVEIINTAIKVNSKIDFIILDEAHRIPSNTFFQVFTARKPSIVLGLSATFSRLDGRHELLNQFCPVCDVITIKEAIENKWLSPYKEYKVLIEVDDIADYNYYNQEFYSAFSFFGNDFQEAMKCLTNARYRNYYASVMGYKAGVVAGMAKKWKEFMDKRKRFVMEHPKKIDITRKILAARPNSKALTFSSTIKQAEKIGGGYVVHSGKTKKKNRLTLEEFCSISSGVMHTAKSLDEGADIPGLNLAIILCNTSSGTQKTQRIGRIIRYQEGKEAELFTLVISGTNEESWYNNSTAGKSYIEISETELDELLAEKQTFNYEQIAKEDGLLFRF